MKYPMHKAARLIVANVRSVLTALVLLGIGSALAAPRPAPGKDQDLSKVRSVAVYVRPSGRDTLDRSFSAVAVLDFISLGYNVVDCNQLLRDHADSLDKGADPGDTRKALQQRAYIPAVEVIAVWRPKWDTSMFVTSLNHIPVGRGTYTSYHGYKVLTLSAKFNLLDAASGDEVLSSENIDTTRLYHLPDQTVPTRGDFPWQLAARQLNQQLASIPVCQLYDTTAPKYMYPVVFDVHEDYRKQFPSDWKLRLQRRLLYASDIFRRQFNMGFELRGFAETERSFQLTLEHSIENLKFTTKPDDGAIHIGVTVDPSLTWNWNQRRSLGFAYGLEPMMMITAQPSLPGLNAWSSLEEALTLVHEFGHVFGAGHATDQSSIMFPSSGSMAFLFDRMNEEIIDSMKIDFLHESRLDKDNRYLRLVAAKRKLPAYRNSAAILEFAASAAQNIMWADSQARHPGSKIKALHGAGAALKLDDPALRDAIDGYIEFKAANYEKAIDSFAKAVAEDPDFGEAYAYYYRALRKDGKSTEAAAQLDRAIQLQMGWAINEE